MKTASFKAMRGACRRVAIAALAVLLALACVMPAALATTAEDDSTAIAKSSDGKTNYYSIPMAWEAATSGTKIIMFKDWQLNTALTLPEGKTATIEMNGHMIYQNLAEIENGRRFFVLEDNSTLNILGEKAPETSFTFYEYSSYAYGGDPQTKTVVSGGLLTAGCTPYDEENDGGGITMYEGSKLRLEGVTIGGCRAQDGGAIDVDGTGCEISLVNSTLDGNAAQQGGAIYIDEDRCTLNMSGSTISNNCSDSEGGAVYSNDYYTKIYMTKKSSFTGNKSLSLYSTDNGKGGAIFFNYPDYTVESSDGTGLFEGNIAATQGGAIYIDQSSFTQNEGHITGITFKSNVATGEECLTSSSNGGAIYVGQEYLFIKDCTFTGNKAEFGGAISVFNDYCNITDTVMTHNSATGNGGAVYVKNTCDITLGGKVIAKDNYCVSNTGELLCRDDIYLPAGGGDEATVLGTPSSGSLVGLRSSKEASDVFVGEKQTAEISGIFFSDYDGYKIEYRSRKLYQVKGDEYTVIVNGETVGVYAKGADVIVDGTSTDPNKTFKTWEGGMDGIDLGYNKDNAVAVFSMPANAVKLTAKYIDRIKTVTLKVDAPKAGEELAEEGEVVVTYDANGVTKTKTIDDVPIVWAEGTGDDAQTVSGTAGYNKSYYAIASVERSLRDNIIFSQLLTDSDMHVKYTGIEDENLGGYEVIDSGDLIIYGKAITTDKATIESVQDVNVSVSADTVTELNGNIPFPDSAQAKLNSGEAVTVAVDNTGVQYDTSEIADGDGKINVKSFIISLPISADDNTGVNVPENTHLNVNVNITPKEKAVTATPEFAYNAESLTVTLTCTTGSATIMYKLDGGTETVYDSVTGIVLTGNDGEKTSHTIIAWAKAPNDEYADSSEATATYVVDKPFTIAVTCKDTSTNDGKLLETKTYKYYKDDKVNIVAPVEKNEQFEKWTDASGIDITDVSKTTQTIEKLSGNVSLTAIYNPIVKNISLTIAQPKAGESLATTLTNAAVDVTASDIASYFSEIKWTPADTTAAYSTGYTAKLTLKANSSAQSNIKFLFSENPVITVNGGTGDITASMMTESGKECIYIFFPATEKPGFKSAQNPADKTLSRSDVADENWSDKLPSYATITLADDSQALASVEWTTVPSFDLDNEEAQTITATGIIKASGLPEDVKFPEGTESVEVMVNVTIPAKEKPAPDSAATDSTTTTAAPMTDDTTNLLAVVFISCISAAMVVLLVQKRKKQHSR